MGEDSLNAVLPKNLKPPDIEPEVGDSGNREGLPPPLRQRKCVSLSSLQSILGIVVKWQWGAGEKHSVTLCRPERAGRDGTEFEGIGPLSLIDEATVAEAWPRGVRSSSFTGCFRPHDTQHWRQTGSQAEPSLSQLPASRPLP